MTKRIVYLDYLRALSIIGIIAIHSFGQLHPVVFLLRFSVPMYVMLSGALLLSEPIPSYGRFVKKRLLRLGLPLIVWSGIFGIWGSLTEVGFSWYNYLFRVVLFGQPFYLLFVLLCLYFITPLLQSWLQNISTKQQQILTISTLLLAGTAASLENWLLAGSNILPHFSFTYFLYFVGYYLAGYVLHQQSDKTPMSDLITRYIASSILMAFPTMLLVERLGMVPKALIFYDYLSFPVIILSLSVFMIVKKLNPCLAGRRAVPLITTLSNASFGMYFLHMLLIPYIAPYVSPWLTCTLAIVGSYSFTLLLSRIPKINQILGCTA